MAMVKSNFTMGSPRATSRRKTHLITLVLFDFFLSQNHELFFKAPSNINRPGVLNPQTGMKMTGQETRVNSYLPEQTSRARYNKSSEEYKLL